ncbi:threonine ammonia-lyase [Desulfofundulus salinus]|uniref:L-threonine dehydratase catabolic TdcB n=1 Tax=Desulfofundulus salinus TaxID=2419843 RepID=A0A494WWI9_9FIRM|nr:threonine ammonia-lyase [Desulfofundulus salinum]RKO67908.1 threonine ammonia-lyase [Desulfofundulus salinum]
MSIPLNLAMIQEARKRLAGVIHHTPLDHSTTFSRLTGREVYFKLENLQKTGSFKIRGAYNKIMSLTLEERQRGVIAASAGNHAQGVAYAATRAGIPSTVVMPEGAPISKVMATRGYGAQVILAGGGYDEAFDYARRMQKETGATLVHGFDDPLVAAGQGTIGLELLDELPDLDAVLVPVGGGGLIAGIAVAIKSLKPQVRVIGIQSRGAPAVYLSLKGDHRQQLVTTATIADGISVRRPGEFTLEVMRRYVDDVLLVDDEEIARAILMLLERSKIVVEGAGAVVLAALLHGHLSLPGAKVALVLSGGNIDVNILSIIIERGLVKSGRIIRLRTVVTDQPGSLQRLLGVLAAVRANVISINHDRIKPQVPLKQAEVELLLETSDVEHMERVMAALTREGYRVERI